MSSRSKFKDTRFKNPKSVRPGRKSRKLVCALFTRKKGVKRFDEYGYYPYSGGASFGLITG